MPRKSIFQIFNLEVWESKYGGYQVTAKGKSRKGQKSTRSKEIDRIKIYKKKGVKK
jgi:hypothetical protein